MAPAGARRASATALRLVQPAVFGLPGRRSASWQSGALPRACRVPLLAPRACGSRGVTASYLPTHVIEPDAAHRGDVASVHWPDVCDAYDFFHFGRVLGCGSQGTAYEVIERATGVGYACKTVPKILLGKSPQLSVQFDKELKNMALCSGHDNVVAFKGVYENDTHIHLITELARGGELFDYVAQIGALSEARAGVLLHQICSSLQHVHSCNVMHRDVKLENFVFSAPTAEGDSKLKLIDFGLSSEVDSDQPLSMVGSPAYVAPEVVKGERYDQACDVWSTGVLSYAMLSGTMPFDGTSMKDLRESSSSFDHKLECPPLEGVSAGCKDFVSQALTVSVERRPSMSKLLEHPWLMEMNR